MVFPAYREGATMWDMKGAVAVFVCEFVGALALAAGVWFMLVLLEGWKP